MSNSYFQFKQFRIEQDKCAMKVSTDACIQGAWTPILPGVKHVLDIGTGTGLLSLMLAQRHPEFYIDAVELDEQAAMQAKGNITNSTWCDNIHVAAGDIRTYDVKQHYDLVICNPPFFRNGLPGNDDARNMARHGLSLSYNELFATLNVLMAPAGYASILLPNAEFSIWEKMLNDYGWYIFNKLEIYPNVHKIANRIVGLCCRDGVYNEQIVEHLHIRDADGYSGAFKTLLSPFYLGL